MTMLSIVSVWHDACGSAILVLDYAGLGFMPRSAFNRTQHEPSDRSICIKAARCESNLAWGLSSLSVSGRRGPGRRRPQGKTGQRGSRLGQNRSRAIRVGGKTGEVDAREGKGAGEIPPARNGWV